MAAPRGRCLQDPRDTVWWMRNLAAPSQLAAATVIKVLQTALGIAAVHRYKPQLLSQLLYNISSALSQCEDADRDPQEVLDCYIRSEWTLVNCHYPSRLSARLPDHQAHDLDGNFPIRSAALKMGITVGRSLVPNNATRNINKIQITRMKPEKTPESRRQDPKPKVLAVGGSKIGPSGFLQGAPSADIRSPDIPPANITIAEIICFFPQWLKSVDVIDRAMSNGGTPVTIARILKAHRVIPDENDLAATFRRMIRDQMRRRGGQYKDWTVATHKPPRDHDSNSISVANFRSRHLFRDLGKGISQFPSGSDALDLTRCVAFAMDSEHQHEDWIFPDKLEELVNILGGPTAVCRENLDISVFDRWNSKLTNSITRRRLEAGRIEPASFSNPSRKRASEDSVSDDALDESDCVATVSEPTEQHPSSKRPRTS